MAVNISISLSGSVTITDNQLGSVPQNIPVLATFVGSVAEYYPSFSVGTGTTTPTLPISPVQFVYLKNLSTTATITATWTPNGGSTATILTLQPGSTLTFAENIAGSGITALSMTASAGSTPCQMVLAG